MNNSIVSLLSELRDLGIHLAVENETLKVRAPKASVTPELKERIQRNKKDIVSLLSRQASDLVAFDRIPRRTDNTNLPLSYFQRKLWLIDQLEGTSIHYNMPNVLKLEGRLDIAALKRSLETIIERHESLRTVFRMGAEGRPQQVVRNEFDFRLPQMDFTALSEQQRAGAILEEYTRDLHTPFDLSSDLMLRAKLMVFGETSHALLLDTHHIASDGWSLDVLYRELCELYLAYSSGRSNPLPELEIQYPDYSVWMESWLQGEALDTQLSYWKQHLESLPVVHNLPLDKPRPKTQTLNGRLYVRDLDRASYEKIKAFSERKNVTLFMLMQSAFAALLSRWSGDSDVVMGTPISNRARPELAPLIGFFTNTLVLRSHCDVSARFSDFLSASKKMLLETYENQHIPFDMLVDHINPVRSLAHNALAQITFALENKKSVSADAMKLPSLRILPLSAEREIPNDVPSKFDLEFVIWESSKGFTFHWTYNRDLFDNDTIVRMDRQYAQLLENILAAPELPIYQLFQMDAAEREALRSWNRTEVAFPETDTLVSMLEAQAAKTPDHTALIFADQTLIYAELHRRANRLAHYLLETQDIHTGQLVGLCAERSLEMVVGLLAILKAGGGYVPLDPGLPAQRLAYLAADSGLGLILVQPQTRARLDGSAACLIDIAGAADAACPDTAPAVAVAPHQPAYAIYTSGSTGQPKGALNRHSGICNKLHSLQHQFRLNAADRVLQKTPINFDVSVTEVFWPLSVGGSVVLAEPEAHKDPERLAAVIQQFRVSITHFVPSMLQLFLRAVDTRRIDSLRLLFAGGEALSYELQKQAIEAFPGVELVNQYGPTEAAVDVAYWHLNQLRNDKKVPIGRPCPNVRLYILDTQGQVVPIGVAGELYIAGVQVGAGYLGREALTAERFISREVLGRPERLYRTGDRARWLADGNIEYLGRLDDQVKLRGFRIELGEIESCLQDMPGVTAAAVLLREDSPDHANTDREKTQSPTPVLVAYFAAAGDTLDAQTLNAHLKQRLPDYMVPRFFVCLPALPLTASGKLDRRALPRPNYAAAPAALIAPGTVTESALVELFAELLQREAVCVTANFFELGGHSLLATELRMHIQQRLARDVPLKVIFEHPVVRDLARWLDGAAGAAVAEIPALTADNWQLSFAQQRLWFIAQFEGASSYNIHNRLRLVGELDIPALQRAFAGIVERHSVCRQVFPMLAGKPRVALLPAYQPLTVHSLEHLAALARAAELEALSRAHAGYGFDIAREPLLRAQLLVLEKNQHVMLLTIHHIISDGQSFPILMRELVHLYEAQRRGEAPSLPPLAVQYGDYASWQRDSLAGATLVRQKAYWLEQLAGAPELLALPTDFPRPAENRYRGDSLMLPLPPALKEQLIAFGRQRDCTLFMTLLAGFKLLLSAYSGERDICVGTPIDNRNHHQLKDVMGLFINTLVLRSTVDGEADFGALLESVRRTALEGYSHQDIPFEQLVEELNPRRSLSHNALFQVMFQLENESRETVRVGGLNMQLEVVPDGGAKFDLSLYVLETAAGLDCIWEYSTDLFKPETVARMHAHYAGLLAAAMASPGRALGRLLQPDAGERETLRSWNRTEVAFPETDTLVSMLEAQADKTPEHTALIFADQTLSYAQLHRQANRLAHYLLETQGIETGQLVGLCAERSLEMAVGLLAILKAGGGYVPLDPELPAQRLAYLVADSGLGLILVQPQTRARLDGSAARLIDIAGAADAAYPDTAPAVAVAPHQPAYAIYTSGSTGQPKGALNRHSGICNKLHSLQHQFGLSAADRVLQKTPINFDVSVEEVFWPLTAGATVVLVAPEGHREPEHMAALIERHRVSVVDFVPSMLQLFIRVVDTRGLSSLRLLFAGGEALGYELQKQAVEAFPGVELVNQYGPTEAAVDVAYWHFNQLRDDKKVPIGRPGPNVRLYILDAQGQVVPIGVAGELYIAGVQVGAGYLGREALTAERFISREVLGRPERLYRTGDRARWLADGNIEYLGRLDDQVKIKGFRIELGEIENALLTFTGVKEAAVLARKDTSGDLFLLAALVADGVDATDAEAFRQRIKAYLRGLLPAYMVPDQVLLLEKMPTLPSGKIDKSALKNMDIPVSQSMETYVAPSTPQEQQLCEMFARITASEQVGIHSNFFALGGDSLKAVRLVAMARENRLALTVRDIFEHQTVANLVRFTESSSAGAGVEPVLDLDVLGPACRYVDPLPGGFIDAFPLTSTQRLMLDRRGGDTRGDGVYISQSLHHFADRHFDFEKLSEAIRHQLQRHPLLRAVFAEGKGGEPVQLIRERAKLDIDLVDIAGIGRQEQRNRMLAAMKKMAGDRFVFGDLEQSLIRFTLFARGADEYSLLIVCHHGIEDGWSFINFINQLVQSYAVLKQGRQLPPATERKPIAYRERVALEKQSENCEAHRAYWRDYLQGYIPEAALEPVCAEAGIHTVQLAVAGGDLAQVDSFVRRRGIMLKSAVLAAYFFAIRNHTALQRPLIDVVVNGRTSQMSDPLGSVGLYWSFKPVAWREFGSAVSLAGELNRVLSGHDVYSLYPSDQIALVVSEVQSTAISFNFIHFPDSENVGGEPGTAIQVLPDHEEEGVFHHHLQLAVSLNQGADNLHLTLMGHSAYFREKDIERILNSLINNLLTMNEQRGA